MIKETVTLELTLLQNYVLANQGIEISLSYADVGVVNTVEEAAFEAPPDVERSGGENSFEPLRRLSR